MRVVYDTSVLATILSRRELLLRLQAEITNDGLSLIVSPFILDELERVLAGKFGLTKQAAKSRSRLLARVADIVEPQHVVAASRDPNDDPILATAVAGRATHIVTFDEDLLVLREYRGILIITLVEFKNSAV